MIVVSLNNAKSPEKILENKQNNIFQKFFPSIEKAALDVSLDFIEALLKENTIESYKDLNISILENNDLTESHIVDNLNNLNHSFNVNNWSLVCNFKLNNHKFTEINGINWKKINV